MTGCVSDHSGAPIASKLSWGLALLLCVGGCTFGTAPVVIERQAVPTNRIVAFIAAAAQGDLNIVERTIAQGIDVNIAESDRRVTALHSAAANGQTHMVKRLLSAGADPMAVDLSGATPLVNAAYAGHIAAMDVLLEKINVEEINGSKSHFVMAVSPLNAAVLGGQRAAVERLIVAGFSPTVKDRQGYDAIESARRAKRSDLVDILQRTKPN